MSGETEGLTDRQVRDRVRQIADRHLFSMIDLVRRRADADGLWEPPGDLAEWGDGSGLVAIYRQQVLAPAREALERAESELAGLVAAVEAEKRRKIGPGYRPIRSDGAAG